MGPGCNRHVQEGPAMGPCHVGNHKGDKVWGHWSLGGSAKPRKCKLIEAKQRLESRNQGQKRFDEVKPDYSNIVLWPYYKLPICLPHIAIVTGSIACFNDGYCLFGTWGSWGRDCQQIWLAGCFQWQIPQPTRSALATLQPFPAYIGTFTCIKVGLFADFKIVFWQPTQWKVIIMPFACLPRPTQVQMPGHLSGWKSLRLGTPGFSTRMDPWLANSEWAVVGQSILNGMVQLEKNISFALFIVFQVTPCLNCFLGLSLAPIKVASQSSSFQRACLLWTCMMVAGRGAM